MLKSVGFIFPPEFFLPFMDSPPVQQLCGASQLAPDKSDDGRGGYEIVDFAELPGVPCPCGTARRAFLDVSDFPASIHVTEIAANAQTHYHRRLTETYYILDCEPDAWMELNGERVPVRAGQCVLIRPGTRHRAVGQMKVLIVVLPKFDPEDEWFDECSVV